jgi:hypothetical protein
VIGHFAKAPSVFAHRIDVARETIPQNGLLYLGIKHGALEMHLRAVSAELTITERPLSFPGREVSSQRTGE